MNDTVIQIYRSDGCHFEIVCERLNSLFVAGLMFASDRVYKVKIYNRQKTKLIEEIV